MAAKTARDDSGLFFKILDNIMTGKSPEAWRRHVSDESFHDVYSKVGVEKALAKCGDPSFVKALADIQPDSDNVESCEAHYCLLTKMLPRARRGIDWKCGL